MNNLEEDMKQASENGDIMNFKQWLDDKGIKNFPLKINFKETKKKIKMKV